MAGHRAPCRGLWKGQSCHDGDQVSSGQGLERAVLTAQHSMRDEEDILRPDCGGGYTAL